MLEFEKFTLKNGLKVILHHDASTPFFTMNILYNVGSRDEHPEKTGFAHLFEHLMFGGSKNIPVYDEPLEKVGGDNNAFTNNDITNYYLSLPKENLEMAFWLESDRMLDLAFSAKSLDVQRNVVVEEFNQRYLNQPYGDMWLKFRPLAYKVHPYQWSTIGKEISHIREATMEDVKSFYQRFYNPQNAILTIAGDIDFNEIQNLTEKWFGSIEKTGSLKRQIPSEPVQTEKRELVLSGNVPQKKILMGFHMSDRMNIDYYTTDLISDILSNGNSSRLYAKLVKEKQIFSSIDAYITGDIDPGLFLISGKLSNGILFEKAEQEIWDELKRISNEKVANTELEKVKNKIESSMIFSETSVLNKAMNLSYYELLGDANLYNEEISKYRNVSLNDILTCSSGVFREENCSVLYYDSK